MNSDLEVSTMRKIVYELCADERELLGDDIVEETIRGRRQFMSLDGGENIDNTAVITGLVAIMNFGIAVMKLREEFSKKSHISENTGEFQVIRKEALDKIRHKSSITVEQQDRIITIIFSEGNDDG